MHPIRVLRIGLDPSVVDYSKIPGLTPQLLRGAIEAARDSVSNGGYDAQLCLIDCSRPLTTITLVDNRARARVVSTRLLVVDLRWTST